MTAAAPPRIPVIPVLEAEIDQLRDELTARVARLEALRDLLSHATQHRDRTDQDPSLQDLFAAADEYTAAQLRGLVKRLTEGEIDNGH